MNRMPKRKLEALSQGVMCAGWDGDSGSGAEIRKELERARAHEAVLAQALKEALGSHNVTCFCRPCQLYKDAATIAEQVAEEG